MKRNEPGLVISKGDYRRLSSLISACRASAGDLLEEELGRAEVVEESEMPADVVMMNSVVGVRDEEHGTEMEITLVYPHEADGTKGLVSVLAPMGMALIGLRREQRYRWPMPGGREKNFRVTSIRPREVVGHG